MAEIALTIGFLIVGFIVLLKGADFLVGGASSLARRYRISDLVIGLTIVSFGTSLPELMVNIFASAQGETALAVGNALGSNIFNILVILGVSAVIFPLKVTKGTVWKEIPLALLAAVMLGVLANDALINGQGMSALTRTDGIVLLTFFGFFLIYTFGLARRRDGIEDLEFEQRPLRISAGMIVGGLAALAIGGKWLVDSAVDLALQLGVSESLVGLTILAVGTSLPELATSAVAAYRKNPHIAVGNIVGSNIFNIFFVLAISSLIAPLPFQESSLLDVGMVIGASLLLFGAMFVGRKRVLDRWQGAMFIVLYIAYVAVLIGQG